MLTSSLAKYTVKAIYQIQGIIRSIDDEDLPNNGTFEQREQFKKKSL